jgi:transcriptional regulator with XRE-family HTH domain/tetratricopeptide (TPR) repeat protein
MPRQPRRREDLGRALGFLREIRGWSQEQLAKDSHVKLTSIKQIEQGRRGPSPRTLGLILRSLRFSLETLGELLALVRRLRTENGSRPAAASPGQVTLPGHLGHDLLALFAPAPPVHAAHRPSALPASREPAPALWERLRACSEPGQLDLVREAAAFQTPGFAELLCEESRKAAADSAARARHLATCAVAAAAAVPADEAPRPRLEGYCRFHLGNASRVGGDLEEADRELAHAEKLWTAGAGDDSGLLNEARVLHIQAALRREQRRLPEALALLDRALAIDGWGETPKLLMSKAKALEELGRHDAAIALLLEAGAQFEGTSESRDLWVARQSRLVNLCHLGRHAEAELGMADLRALAARLGNQQLDLLRIKWLQGKIAAGRGLTGEAITALAAVRAQFLHQANAYDTALVTLELAQVFAALGRTAEVKALAQESAPIFEAQGVHREARQALALFRQAAEEERVSAELVCGVVTYLYRSRYDARVRYKAAA